MTTARKLWFGFGALTALLALFGALMFVRLQSIEQHVHLEAEVARPRAEAARKLELNVRGYVLNVRAHLAGNPQGRPEAAAAAAEVDRQLAKYNSLAETPRQRDLAAEFASQWRELEALGQTLLEAAKATPVQEQRLFALRIRLERFLDEEMQRDANENYEARKQTAFQDIRAMISFLLILTSGCVAIALLTSVAVGRSVLGTEDALRERTERYELVAAGAGDAIWDWDILNHRVDFSPRWKEMRGFAPDEVSDREDEWSSRIDPDDVSRVMAAVQSHFEGKTAFFAEEYRVRCKDGSWKWILDRGIVRRDSAGRPIRMAGSESDITERKQAEEALRDREARLTAILTTAADAIVTIDQRGMIQSVNAAAERMFGHRAAEMIGQNISLLVPSLDQERRDGYLQRCVEEGADIIGVGKESLAQRRDGSLFSVELGVSQVPELNLFTVILRDITRRKELEREVVEIASLEQRRIGQDLHDSVGQELTALNMLAADLAESLRADPSSGPKLVEQMARGLQRSQKELRNVLRGLLPVAVDAEGLMAALSDLADRVQKEGKAACRFDCPTPVSVADNLSATHLYLIAQEAVHNAIKHAQARNIDIILASNDLLTLSVQDDGGGMATPATEKLGGLGLRIMENRAAIIGAKLTIEPAKPKGTVVTCILPRKNHEPE